MESKPTSERGYEDDVRWLAEWMRDNGAKEDGPALTKLASLERLATRRTDAADRLLDENRRLREVLARVRPDIDPETGYGRTEAV